MPGQLRAVAQNAFWFKRDLWCKAIWQAYALRMGLSLDYLVERVIPQMMTEHYELVTANPELADALTEARWTPCRTICGKRR